MLIGNRSAPLSALLFAAAQGVADTNRRMDGWIAQVPLRERERKRCWVERGGRAECKRSTLGVFTGEKEYEKSMRT